MFFVDIISHVDPTIVLLTIDGELIETTAEHPFYEMESAPWLAVGQTEGRWTDALDLQSGDRVWKADGTSGVVQSVAVAPVQQPMYNLTVVGAHTFFVGRGQWLVHNASHLQCKQKGSCAAPAQLPFLPFPFCPLLRLWGQRGHKLVPRRGVNCRVDEGVELIGGTGA